MTRNWKNWVTLLAKIVYVVYLFAEILTKTNFFFQIWKAIRL